MLGIPFYGHGWLSVIIGIVVLAILWFVLGYQLKANGQQPKALVSARIKNTSLLCMLMLMIGYSTYALIVIRSSANPPMDQNSPEDIFTLGDYLGRDQYGNRPLFYGQAYTSQVALEVDGGYE
jgi:ABC-type phosphate transport system permease subunit